ncbi:MFS family permease [Paraburkholderia youngii]|uniref:MFS transporter n=1 Tax=Paraburkholderia youngii TaxID=2782701 RepID=UPI003D19F96C
MRVNSTSLETAAASVNSGKPGVGRAAWIVLGSAFLGWMFDAMDVYLIVVVIMPALHDLLGTSHADASQIQGVIVGAKLLCWGIGGITFGVLADKFGRARVMLGTMLIYSGFTAASAFAQSWHQLLLIQMLAGFGIGGEWAAGASLVVETWPEKHRAKAVQVMQFANVVGLIIASALGILLAGLGWRWVLAVGALPAVVSLGLRFVTPESKRWKESRIAEIQHAGPKMGSLSVIFRAPLRRRTIVGSLVAAAMMIGSWGTTVLIPALLRKFIQSAGDAEFMRQTSISFTWANVGAVLGFGLTLFLVAWNPRISRRVVYALFCTGAWLATIALVTVAKTLTMFHLAMFAFGLFAIGGFGILALYLTELFPLHVRGTGQGFTWNVARIFTAAGPLGVSLALAKSGIYVVGVSISAAFWIGLVAIRFGPETSSVAKDGQGADS